MPEPTLCPMMVWVVTITEQAQTSLTQSLKLSYTHNTFTLTHSLKFSLALTHKDTAQCHIRSHSLSALRSSDLES